MYLLPLLIDKMANFIYKTRIYAIFYLSAPEYPSQDRAISLKKKH